MRWLTPALLETNDPDAHTPQVGVDGDGNAIATWTQADGPFVRVWTSRFVVGTGWSPATRIDSSDAGNALLPKVAVSAAGTAFVVWTQSEGTSSGIWANRFTIGAGWGTATPIGSSVGFVALSPQVAIDDAGNALAAWSESDGTRLNIRANRFVVGSGWGTAGLIESNDSGSASYPQVKMDGAGNAFAVWQQGDGARTDIRANRFVAGTGWGTATLIEHDDTGSASSPKLAVDKLGNAMVVWHQSDGTRFNIRANRFVVGAGWGTETLIESDNTGDAYSPAIAVDLAGNATVVWHQSDGTRVNIRANRFVVGTGWGSETLIESDDAGDAYSPRVEAARDGAVIAVWSQSDGTRSNIYANRFVVGSGWSTAKLIEANDSGDASAPEIAIDGSGNAVAVWEQGDGARSNVWASVRR